ncbi:TKL/TKL-ccin protein kinase [Coprinopsis cinerea okayama7|uniref:TKL/TKL-ccin protein kinase n=1 Tax=Coprinopsis cinerea (strain Okayama-7 / 130 / ATCC MYA-4618 / FGSC 9003) TaxID=240176 RepID=A8NV44_COPC7|nr:TKL/TKL-ccin protein kinase [Coprinopsis cinerea okayama7\|eukprot:XP_001836596.2 TKL/TKL-ccin protein kinase [Coprinopsis cinerea okayama7\
MAAYILAAIASSLGFSASPPAAPLRSSPTLEANQNAERTSAQSKQTAHDSHPAGLSCDSPEVQGDAVDDWDSEDSEPPEDFSSEEEGHGHGEVQMQMEESWSRLGVVPTRRDTGATIRPSRFSPSSPSDSQSESILGHAYSSSSCSGVASRHCYPLRRGSTIDLVTEALDLSAEIEICGGSVAHGGYSDVYRAKWTTTTGSVTGNGNWIVNGDGVSAGAGKGEEVVTRDVAVKTLRAFSQTSNVDLNRARKRLNREVHVLKRLNHPNIAEFYGIAFHKDGRPSVVMKWYRYGTAPEYLAKNAGVDRLGVVRDVAAGLEYLHTLQPPVVHGDLKGSNTLVDESGRVVLSDFGLSKVMEQVLGPTGFTTSTCAGGTVRWLAPELLFDPRMEVDPYDDEDIEAVETPTMASDIWSLGCVAYELATGKYPYADERYDYNVMQAIMNKNRTPADVKEEWTGESRRVYRMLSRCWVREPSNRGNIREIVNLLRDH